LREHGERPSHLIPSHTSYNTCPVQFLHQTNWRWVGGLLQLRASNDALQYCSFQARSLSLQGWGLIDLPLRATFSPAHPLARRDVPLARARASCFPLCTITPSRPRESPDRPLLRASDEHRFIVRVLRARRMVWWLPIAPFLGRALREHRRSSGSIPPHTSSAPTGPRRPTTSLRPSRPAAPTRPSASICSIIRAARG
jgi:hypothetical protein